MYLIITKSDITYVVIYISYFMHTPKTSHMNMVDGILRCLKFSPSRTIWTKKNDHANIVGYSYTEYAVDPNDRR